MVENSGKITPNKSNPNHNTNPNPNPNANPNTNPTPNPNAVKNRTEFTRINKTQGKETEGLFVNLR